MSVFSCRNIGGRSGYIGFRGMERMIIPATDGAGADAGVSGILDFNALRLSDAYIRQTGAKPLSELILDYCWLDH